MARSYLAAVDRGWKGKTREAGSSIGGHARVRACVEVVA